MNGHGGARKGAGRRSACPSNLADLAMQYLCECVGTPSLAGFCCYSAINPKSLSRWQLKYGAVANAVGVIRYRREVALGLAA